MNVKFFFVSALMLFVFTACEGETTRTWTVQNNSSSTIYVTSATYAGSSTSDSVLANQSQIIATDVLDEGTDSEGIPSEEFSSFSVSNSSGVSTTKSYQNVENWNSTIEQTKSTPATFEHQYIFTVTDADF
ncbi:MAG: hypothetical protein QNK23_08025 [Crocinitomicaceae bacterium]|nr:hypothetical protein [Crocinitomicaceae bacterium]